MLNLSLPRRARATSSSASASVIAIGFSRNTCLPAARQSRAIGKCVLSGVAEMYTALIDGWRLIACQSSVAVFAPVIFATSSSRSGRTSAICSALTSGCPARARARMPPHQPVPMIPTSIACISPPPERPFSGG